MGMTLKEYAMAHPEIEPSEWHNAAEQVIAYKTETERMQKAAELKEIILAQLDQGGTPEYVLHTAIRAIGILTEDPEWAITANGYIERVYADLQQQHLFVDNASLAAERHEEIHREYIGKVRKRLETCEKDYKKLQKALTDAITAINEML